MGLDLGSAVNSAADWLCSAPLIRGLVSNPMFMALLIVSLAAVVVMAFYHYQIKQAGLKKGLRAFIYVFLIVLVVIFIHHYATIQCLRQTTMQKGVREVFSSIEQSRTVGFGIPVVPGDTVQGRGENHLSQDEDDEEADINITSSDNGGEANNIKLDDSIIIEDVVV